METACIDNGVDAVLLLACLQAESGLDPYAVRKGEWPDWSAGMGQQTVQTAGAYGIGDGTPASWETVKAALFDRVTAIDLTARHLAGCQARADGDALQALIAYNSGSPQPEGNWYWIRYAANIASYQRALVWSRSVV